MIQLSPQLSVTHYKLLLHATPWWQTESVHAYLYFDNYHNLNLKLKTTLFTSNLLHIWYCLPNSTATRRTQFQQKQLLPHFFTQSALKHASDQETSGDFSHLFVSLVHFLLAGTFCVSVSLCTTIRPYTSVVTVIHVQVT